MNSSDRKKQSASTNEKSVAPAAEARARSSALEIKNATALKTLKFVKPTNTRRAARVADAGSRYSAVPHATVACTRLCNIEQSSHVTQGTLSRPLRRTAVSSTRVPHKGHGPRVQPSPTLHSSRHSTQARRRGGACRTRPLRRQRRTAVAGRAHRRWSGCRGSWRSTGTACRTSQSTWRRCAQTDRSLGSAR